MSGEGSFHSFMLEAQRVGELVVQPRMGFGTVERMRTGLLATRDAGPRTVGTLTLDSYTRVGDFAAAAAAMRTGSQLNGYPIVNLGPEVTRQMLVGVRDEDFVVQVRHGSATPGPIVEALMAAGLDATEGGPISYCLPYGRTPVNRSVAAWAAATEQFALLADTGVTPHLESFGGCLLGQLCPPSLLIATSVLEALFFAQHGMTSVSLSYAQQTHPGQDEEAVRALHDIAADLLPTVSWHVVIYAYMGLFPATYGGSLALLADAARLAARGGAARLIVKTPAESSQIPSIEDNVTALRVAAAAAREVTGEVVPGVVPERRAPECTGVEAEARQIIDRVLDLHDDIGRALTTAFALGVLDVPYCLHPDNAGRARSYIADDGRLRWAAAGGLPVGERATEPTGDQMTSTGLLRSLSNVRDRYDTAALTGRQKELLPGR